MAKWGRTKLSSATASNTGSGDTFVNRHDISGRLRTTNLGMPREQQITYDANGNLKTISNPRRPWEDVSYSYFDTGWLKAANGPYGSSGYTYDDAGNRLTRYTQMFGTRELYHYESGTNRISSITDIYGVTTLKEFAHDARGNMTLYDGKSLSYNADNRLMSVTEEGATIAMYTYNGFGQRISKNVTATNETTVFLWDFDGNIIAEYDGTGMLKAEYLYRGANRLAMADAAGEVYFYQNDRLGTPLAVTDKDNNAVWEATYLPFGEAMVNPNSTVENNFRFPGQYYDEETGLHYNYHRYYDPRVGRYVTADPIGLAGGINPFFYVHNDPINWVDQRGLVDPVTGSMVTGAMSSGLGVGATGYARTKANRQIANTLWSNSTLNPETYLKALIWLAETVDKDGNGECELPNQGSIDGGIEGAPLVDAGSQGKHVIGHNNEREEGSKWNEGETGVKETQEAWVNGSAVKPDGSVRIGTSSDGRTIKVHKNLKGTIHGYPID